MYHFENTKLGLKGTLDGLAPVQADGTVDGFPFYFRSRHSEWTFAISEKPEVDPVDIQYPEQGEQFGFFTNGQYGDEIYHKASYMDNDTALNIIENSVSEYLRQKVKD